MPVQSPSQVTRSMAVPGLGAGMVFLRMLEREELRNHVVVVTRWFGGKQLGGERFRHVQEAVRTYIKAL
jgi:putative IMPACT (imprinted ancient) family translation regulator